MAYLLLFTYRVIRYKLKWKWKIHTPKLFCPYKKPPRPFATIGICFAQLHNSSKATNLKREIKREKPSWDGREVRKELQKEDR